MYITKEKASILRETIIGAFKLPEHLVKEFHPTPGGSVEKMVFHTATISAAQFNALASLEKALGLFVTINPGGKFIRVSLSATRQK